MMVYYAKLKKQDKGFYVEFPGLSGCLTEGLTRQEAKENAKEALNGWLSVNCDRNFEIPRSRKVKGGVPIQVEVCVEFAIRLRQIRKKKKLSQKQIADRLGVSQQAYAKFEIPGKANPSLLTLEKISQALDAKLDLRLAA